MTIQPIQPKNFSHTSQSDMRAHTRVALDKYLHDREIAQRSVDNAKLAIATANRYLEENQNRRKALLKALDSAKAAVAKAEEECVRAQDLVSTELCEWPVFAMEVLKEHAEIAPSVDIQAMEMELRHIDYIEDHFAEISMDLRPLLGKSQIPWQKYIYFREATMRKQQRHNASLPPGDPHRRGDADLLPYEGAVTELEKLLAVRTASYREKVIRDLVHEKALQAKQEQAAQPAQERPFAEDLDVPLVEISLAAFKRETT